MSLVFQNVQLHAGSFGFELNAELGARATGVFGPSGAGKTTLLEIVAGLRRPDAGTVRLGDTVLTDVARGVHLPPEQRRIGYVPQDGALFPHLDVAHNLRYGRRHPPAADAPVSFDQVCAVLDLTGLTGRRIDGLSGGERQRVALGRALLAAPRLLLLDEPLASLDAERKATILPYLQRVREEFGVPLLYVSHIPGELLTLCDDLLVFAAGRLSVRGAPASLFEETTEPHFRLRGDAGSGATQ